MKKILVATLMLLALSALPAQAQSQDVCTTVSTPPFTLTTGAPYTIAWLMDATVPLSDTDPTLVPQRIDGFTIQVDAGVKQEIGVPAASTCATGTLNAGKLAYSFRTASGVAKGSHTLTLTPWNFAIDPVTGAITTTVAPGPPVAIPFVVVDPVRVGPPTAPKNAKVKR